MLWANGSIMLADDVTANRSRMIMKQPYLCRDSTIKYIIKLISRKPATHGLWQHKERKSSIVSSMGCRQSNCKVELHHVSLSSKILFLWKLETEIKTKILVVASVTLSVHVEKTIISLSKSHVALFSQAHPRFFVDMPLIKFWYICYVSLFSHYHIHKLGCPACPSA